VLRVKKLLKTIKLKHAARLFLFMFLLFVLCIPCSAAVVTTVSFTNELGAPYGGAGIKVYSNLSDDSNFVTLNVGSSSDVVFEPSYSSDSILHVVNGTIDLDSFTIDVSDYLPDGTYSCFGSIITSVDVSGSDVFYPEISGSFIFPVNEGVSYGFSYYDSIPSNIDVTIAYEDLSHYSYGLGIVYLLLIPYEEPTVVDNISNVWSNILLWITSSINTVTGIFWTGTQLTLIGTLALAGTVIALCLLIFYKVKDYLKLQ
jgi:hypothetical protein